MLELAINGMDLKLRYKNGPFNFQELGVLTASGLSKAGCISWYLPSNS